MRIKSNIVTIFMLFFLNLAYGNEDGIVIENYTTESLSPGLFSLISLVENDYSPIIDTQKLTDLEKYYNSVEKNKDFQFRNIDNKLYGYFIFENKNNEVASDLKIELKVYEVENILENKLRILLEKTIEIKKEDYNLIVNAQTDSVRHSLGCVLTICDFNEFLKKPEQILGSCDFKIISSKNEVICQNDNSLFLLSETKLNNLLINTYESLGNIKETEYRDYIKNSLPEITNDDTIVKKVLSNVNSKIMPDLRILDVSIRCKPKFIVENEEQLQVIIPTLSSFKLEDKIIEINTEYFGISDNDGRSWYFIDKTYLNSEDLELLVPKLSNVFK